MFKNVLGLRTRDYNLRSACGWHKPRARRAPKRSARTAHHGGHDARHGPRTRRHRMARYAFIMAHGHVRVCAHGVARGGGIWLQATRATPQPSSHSLLLPSNARRGHPTRQDGGVWNFVTFDFTYRILISMSISPPSTRSPSPRARLAPPRTLDEGSIPERQTPTPPAHRRLPCASARVPAYANRA